MLQYFQNSKMISESSEWDKIELIIGPFSSTVWICSDVSWVPFAANRLVHSKCLQSGKMVNAFERGKNSNKLKTGMTSFNLRDCVLIFHLSSIFCRCCCAAAVVCAAAFQVFRSLFTSLFYISPANVSAKRLDQKEWVENDWYVVCAQNRIRYEQRMHRTVPPL